MSELRRPKKVLVVGGCGYIGSAVVDHLWNDSSTVANVAIYDNLLYDEKYLGETPFHFGCITETDRLVAIANEFDCVIWLAALVGDPACEIDPEWAWKINYESIRDFSAKLDPKVELIFISTCSVYGISNEILNEDSPVNPISVYASTKLEAEKHVIDRGGVVFRLGTVYGHSSSQGRLRFDLVVNIMAIKSYLEGVITVNGGDQWRPIISVRTVAKYITNCVENYQPGIYILSERNITIRDLGIEISNITGAEVKFNDIQFKDIRNYRVDSSKAQKTFPLYYEWCLTFEEEVKRVYNLVAEKRVKNPYSTLWHNGLYLRNYLGKQ